MTRIWCAFMALLGLASCGGGSPTPTPVVVPPTTIADLGSFLAPTVCADGSFAFLSGCAGTQRRASDVLAHRLADRSGHTDGQISDAWRSDDGQYFVQTFSYPPNGPFVAAHGDGGDVAVVRGSAVLLDYTQNGTPGGGTIAGYWVGYRCPLGTGWLLFDASAPVGSWRAQVAYLAGSATRDACPRLNAAYTRWRLDTVPVAFEVGGATVSVPLKVVVSEHYAGTSIAGAGSMERVINAQGVGRVLWEAWATHPPTVPMAWACDGVPPYNAAPASGWFLQDRRCLTRVVAGNGLTGNGYGWPAAGFVP